MKKKLLYSFLCLILLQITSINLVFADTTTIYQDDKGKYTVSLNMEYVEDPTGELTIYQVASSEYDSLFKRIRKENPNFGYTSSSYWLRFTIDNQTSRQEDFFLEFNYPLLDNIELYYKEANKWQIKKSGDTHPFEKRELKNRHVIFSLYIPVWESNTYYVKVESKNSSIQVPITLWKPIAFDEYNHDLQFVLGILYGMILLIIVDNLFLYFTIRNVSYLYYVFAMLSSITLLTTLNGHSFEYFWTDFFWIQNNILPFITLSLGFWMGIFCRGFLETKKYAPVYDRLIVGFIWAGVLLVPIVLVLPYRYAIQIAALVDVAEAIILLIASAVCAYRGSYSARYFYVAFSCYMAGLAIYAMKSQNLVPVNFFTEYSVQLGGAIQVTLLAFALGDKFKQLEKERAEAEKEALRMQKEVNEQLEEKVLLRTLEIQEQAAELEESNKRIETLSQIGQEITATLDLEIIFAKLYKFISEVMEVTIFGVDIYYPEKQVIEYKYNIEKGQRLPVEIVSINNDDVLSVWVIKRKQEIIMLDAELEFNQYIKVAPEFLGAYPQSIVFIPLIVGEKILGTITVQSYRKNAYDKQDLQIIRTLGSYTSIAVDNAFAYESLATTNNAMLQSIRYAKRIQDAILPPTELLKNHFTEFFIFYRPRDIVSGDFYWFHEIAGLIIIAVADCTGHGVPGAFMTMMGHDMLGQVVVEKEIFDPAQILLEVDRRVVYSTQHGGEGDSKRNDGMDMSICVIDKQKHTIQYAGAKSPIFLVRNGDIQHIKGSPFPIGSSQFKVEKVYEKHTIDYEERDVLYMFSDGYQDQFGGEQKTKFMTKRFRAFLAEISSLPFGEQHMRLGDEIDQWRNGQKQTDDQLVVGIKL
jgi:serine phosphatase RsbU (regulator of sigma subunit)